MSVSLHAASRQEIAKIKELYRSAFPKEEQKPFWLFIEQMNRGVTDILAVGDRYGFCGFVIAAKYSDMVLIDYFAISHEKRGMGIGSKALAQLRRLYAGKRVFLEIELCEPDAKNLVQRVKRKEFYLKNGLKETDVHICAYNSHMELLTFGCPVTFEEYAGLMSATLGPLIFAIVNPTRLK